ncbi:MAG: type II toxin-antitoxin system PemK/MazF family toxin [Planctomycetota bacterium]|jgi:mRNA interferase MazF
MINCKQGEIWWADLPLPIGRRPVLVLTRSNALPQMSNVTVAPLTRTVRNIQSEVILSPEQGVPSSCAVTLDNILTIRKHALQKIIVELSEDMMHEVFKAIRFALAMP